MMDNQALQKDWGTLSALATPAEERRASIDALLQKNSGIQLDIGCGAHPQPGFVGMDVRPLPTVDIVWDVSKFPWPLPDECVRRAMASHLVEHIPPDGGDTRVVSLVKMLLAKGLITDDEVKEYIGELEHGPRFLRFMNEVWRILKPGGEFMISCPHGYSFGFLQDPTHCNEVCEATFAYFDPLYWNPRHPEMPQGLLWSIYKPKPWVLDPNKIYWDPSANIEVVLVKRAMSEVSNG